MDKESLEIKAKIQVSKPAAVVFEAIVDPEKMSNYFLRTGTHRLVEGQELTWYFPEFDTPVPVRAGKIEENQYISFYWEGAKGKDLLVEITLSEQEKKSTVITVTEKEMNNDEAGIKWLKSNTEGWANFLACLKAYLEYGINLREGGYDFMKTN